VFNNEIGPEITDEIPLVVHGTFFSMTPDNPCLDSSIANAFW
jgi:hypothetical protein